MALAPGAGRYGVIGEPFLHAYRVVLDYRKLEMTLIPPGGQDAGRDGCTGTVVPFLPEWGGPVTKAATDFGDLTMVWDTGAPLSLIRKARADEARAKVRDKIVTTTRFALGDVDFGPLELRVFDYVEPAGTDGFVGHGFFAKHVVCIDFPGKRFLIRN